MTPLPCAVLCAALLALDPAGRAPVAWSDLSPLHPWLKAQGFTPDTFETEIARIARENRRRVREGDLDHLVFYLLQSARFTTAPPLEPALSAKALVDGLGGAERAAFFRDPATADGRVPPAVRARIEALLRALASPSGDARLEYFSALVTSAFPYGAERADALAREYLRAMRFVYEKEFVTQGAGREAVADLYRRRGLSTDTAVEAGFLVQQGLGVVRALDPQRRFKRVLIVGPGLDLAPRTALVEEAPPQSYQPWAVIDALLGLGLSSASDLEVVAADINPRVIAHLQHVSRRAPVLSLATEVREAEGLRLTDEYRRYFQALGAALGRASHPESGSDGRLRKTVRPDPSVARLLVARQLDIVTERLPDGRFDLVIATNILPYFDDVQLALAMANLAHMLVPGGALVHNEPRPVLHELTTALGIPVEQSRHAVIASVRGAAAPLLDSAWVHRKIERPR